MNARDYCNGLSCQIVMPLLPWKYLRAVIFQGKFEGRQNERREEGSIVRFFCHTFGEARVRIIKCPGFCCASEMINHYGFKQFAPVAIDSSEVLIIYFNLYGNNTQRELNVLQRAQQWDSTCKTSQLEETRFYAWESELVYYTLREKV